jgi:heterodisulfide reductase subunit C
VEIAIPVLHLAELIALALGVENIDSLLELHKIKPNFPSQHLESELMTFIKTQLNLDSLKICTRCRACSKDCTLVGSLDFDPLRYVDLIVEGHVLEAIQSEGIWKCLNCYGCYEKCPQRMGLAQFFMKLRNLAIKQGYEPASIAAESGKFLQDGVVTGKIVGGRKRLELPINETIGIKDLKELLEKKAKQDVEI